MWRTTGLADPENDFGCLDAGGDFTVTGSVTGLGATIVVAPLGTTGGGLMGLISRHYR